MLVTVQFNIMACFKTVPGFCTECGCILMLSTTNRSLDTECYNCHEKYKPEVFGDMKLHYTIKFNSVNAYEAGVKKSKDPTTPEAEGPVVERRCPKCNNDVMSYATLQLRSADEGQTVFYTCTKCKYKESENS